MPLTHKASFALALLALSAWAVLPAHAAGPNLVQNPGFETGSFAGWTTTPAATGSNFAVSGGRQHTGAFEASFGAQGSQNDSISQMLTTVAGDNYAISFWLEGTLRSGNEFEASFGGNQIFQIQNSPGFSYTQYTFTATATGTSTALTLGGRTPGGLFDLDDVSVTDIGPAAVPEGSTTVSLGLLLTLGMGSVVIKKSLIAARRRKQNV